MRLTWEDIQTNAVAFSRRWTTGGNEAAQAQSFVTAFLKVFGTDDAEALGDFEFKVPLSDNRTGYVDFLWKNKIAIEMKSRGKSLDDAYAQLKTYMRHLPADEAPDLWLVCDFERMRLYRRSTNDIFNFATRDLRNHIKKFADIAGYETERVREEQTEVNVKAAELMARLHDVLKGHGYDEEELRVYLVRLLFCLFADDTGIFPKGSLYCYIQKSKADGSDLSERIARLFEVLNLDKDKRAMRTLLSEELKQFQYINGSLFADPLSFAEFDQKTRLMLLECLKFDWHSISPAIFGAMFQGVMDQARRRELGAHYTSEANILKLINPLFLEELWNEFDRVKTAPKALERFHDKIAGLKFLDPACGCGNFLIITYRELRKLELAVLQMTIDTAQWELDIDRLLKVSVEQFYGIEYEAFPCEIARVGMWLVDHQMNMEASDLFGNYYARLPLTKSATIVHGNALRMDWTDVVPKGELSYILGNPPFVGNNNLTPLQRRDLVPFFPKNKRMDYVAAWYVKASGYMDGTQIKAALVSTNSISQGEQVALLWKPLVEQGININFGIPTFKWTNEAKGKAAVHCVIVGFSYVKTTPNISPYLFEGPTIFVGSRSKPICDVPSIEKGNQPTDGGSLIIEANDYKGFIAKEPLAQQYIKKLVGAVEFINGLDRYCLWLPSVSPADLRKMPLVLERIELCRQMRLASPDEGTRRLADTPMLFRETKNPETFIVIPSVSSERRRYIPIGFLDKSTIPTNLVLIIPNATFYHFGIITSSVHMAWTRAVCGRLEMRYRYSKDIVYNNFPWPIATDEHKAEIEKLSQAVIGSRALFPESSLADLYDPLSMPPELLKAHNALDKAVMGLYDFAKGMTEADIVAALLERYRRLTEENKEVMSRSRESDMLPQSEG